MSDLTELRQLLEERLRRAYPAVSPIDQDLAIDEALTAFVVAAEQGRVRVDMSPGGYLFVTAERKLLSRLRRAPVLVELSEGLADRDDAIAALLEADATKVIVERAMRHARLARRYALVRIVAAWLDLAERTGAAPTSADVAERVGMTPEAVRQGLSRFREYLGQALQEGG